MGITEIGAVGDEITHRRSALVVKSQGDEAAAFSGVVDVGEFPFAAAASLGVSEHTTRVVQISNRPGPALGVQRQAAVSTAVAGTIDSTDSPLALAHHREF